MSKNDGGIAFPISLRDLIAIIAMHAKETRNYPVLAEDVSIRAYNIADAMLKERDK
mgnify:CR=1 FL=1